MKIALPKPLQLRLLSWLAERFWGLKQRPIFRCRSWRGDAVSRANGSIKDVFNHIKRLFQKPTHRGFLFALWAFLILWRLAGRFCAVGSIVGRFGFTPLLALVFASGRCLLHRAHAQVFEIMQRRAAIGTGELMPGLAAQH
ncbi:hypothetical protein J7399_00970 [Shimia sp. R9_1]|nr:hypothetical protein [Shimia sp. R9_2]MBO9405983.1 hypothetical protein [Shimia sp. R9_1]